MTMERVSTLWRLPGRPDVESRRFLDVHILVWTFRHTSTDDGEIFLSIGTRGMGVDKGRAARLEIAVSNDAVFHFRWSHYPIPFSNGSVSKLLFRHKGQTRDATPKAQTPHGPPP